MHKEEEEAKAKAEAKTFPFIIFIFPFGFARLRPPRSRSSRENMLGYRLVRGACTGRGRAFTLVGESLRRRHRCGLAGSALNGSTEVGATAKYGRCVSGFWDVMFFKS